MSTIATRLGELKDQVVFVGGSTLAFLIEDVGATPPRPTDDVDVIVDLASVGDYQALSQRLLQLGFQPDSSDDAPLCRWTIDGVVVDVMPTTASILGFSNRWYSEAAKHASIREIRPGLSIRVATAPYFLAMKLEAFAGRGNADYLASHDIEDFIAVIDGRSQIVAEIAHCERSLTQYLQQSVNTLLADPAFVQAISGHLPGDPGSQARLPLVINRLEAIAGRR